MTLVTDASTFGAMSGAMIHPLALGNVFTLRKLLDGSGVGGLSDIVIIGAGGVHDHAGFKRMTKAGASAVGIATALGMHGPGIFKSILLGS